MRDAIEQELCTTPEKREDLPAKKKSEHKEHRSDSAPKNAQRPPLKTPSKQRRSNPPPSSHIAKSPNKLDKIAQNYENYITKAKEANTRGDFILAEQFYQQADHYSRLMKEKD